MNLTKAPQIAVLQAVARTSAHAPVEYITPDQQTYVTVASAFRMGVLQEQYDGMGGWGISQD